MKHLKLGPNEPYSHETKTYIAVAEAGLRVQKGGDLLISRECSSLGEIEAQLAEIKADLEEIALKARAHYGKQRRL